MTLQQHIDVSSPRIFSAHFIKGCFDLFHRYDLACFCCLFKWSQYRILFCVRQRPMMGLIFVPDEFFQPLFPIFSAYLADSFFPCPIHLRYLFHFIPLVAQHQHAQSFACSLVLAPFFRCLDCFVFLIAYLESVHFSSPIPLYHIFLLMLSFYFENSSMKQANSSYLLIALFSKRRRKSSIQWRHLKTVYFPKWV